MVQTHLSEEECKFCGVVSDKLEVKLIFSDGDSVAFLDSKPLFFGHCLLIPKKHFKTIMDAPDELLSRLFLNAKLLSKAIKEAMGSDGILLLANNEISESVPHFHIHIIPRKKGDGLHGFMWPRRTYESEAEADSVAHRIIEAVKHCQA